MAEALVPTVTNAQSEIGAVQSDVQAFDEYARTLVVTKDSREAAGESIKTIKGLWNRLEERRKVFTVPLNKVLDEINAIFKKPQAALKLAEDLVKQKCLGYDAEVERERMRLQREAEERARKEQERLNKEAEAAAKKAEKRGDHETAEMYRQTVPQAVVQTPLFDEAPKVNGESTRKVYRAEVVDPLAFATGISIGIIPPHMMEPLLTAIAKSCPRPPADPWPGVKLVEVPILATRAR